MPIVVRPTPPLPMSVAIATRVFGSEVTVALIAYYRDHPGASQHDAVKALDLEQTVISRKLGILIHAGVVITTPNPTDGRVKVHTIDEQRLQMLFDALHGYCT